MNCHGQIVPVNDIQLVRRIDASIYSAFSILLMETGDYTRQNLSSYASQLVTWLQGIGAQLNQ